MPGARYYSQYGEDRFLARRKLTPRRGVFVDVGAGDPARYSNTYFFEQHGWSGLCIDAHPDQVAALESQRRCAVEWAAVTPRGEEVVLYAVDDPDMSSIRAKPMHADSVSDAELRTSHVPARRLDDILNSRKIERIDLLSIDTEGTELEVAETMDWERRRPSIVIVEYLTVGLGSREAAIAEYFASLRYGLLHRTWGNLIYIDSALMSRVRPWPSLRRYVAMRAMTARSAAGSSEPRPGLHG